MIYCCAGGCSLSHIGTGGSHTVENTERHPHSLTLNTIIAPCLRAVGLSEELSDREKGGEICGMIFLGAGTTGRMSCVQG